MENSYAEEVKEKIFELKSGSTRYWTREEETLDRIRTIKRAGFLNENVIQILEKGLPGPNMDIWEMSDRLMEICQEESVELPETEVFAVFVLYVFYGGDIEKLR